MVLNIGQLAKGLNLLSDAQADWEHDGIPGNPSFWWKFTHLKPAVYRGAVVAAIAIAAAFGLVVSDQDTGAAVALVTAVAGLVQGVWTHNATTPNESVVVYKPNPVGEPSVVAPGFAVATDAVAVVNAAADTPVYPKLDAELPIPLLALNAPPVLLVKPGTETPSGGKS